MLMLFIVDAISYNGFYRFPHPTSMRLPFSFGGILHNCPQLTNSSVTNIRARKPIPFRCGECQIHQLHRLLLLSPLYETGGDVGLAELVGPFSFPEKFVAISPGMLSKHVVDRLDDSLWIFDVVGFRFILFFRRSICREKEGQTTS
ncbi:hypothetical protein P4533_13580 [Geobacillus stearothermophilus]|uniref:hypothetical protein n=1 Tax=Geobacillus stearothermophilus TaxID=1422 RepID=UPI002E1F93AA|nr:hypothetical protein [Geobacillus stearothermophilus]